MISIYAIGKNKDKALQSLEKEYCKRLSAFTKCEIIEFKDEANDHVDRESEVEMIKQKEGEKVLSKIRSQDFVILLHLHGDMVSSEKFSSLLDTWQTKSNHIVFVIAGSLGPSEELIQRANVKWKLSDLTFTHLMTRILVLEQIYRGYMIINGRNYHK
ncbi:MAG: 23S rRNA (pseudouridine(1915)-N(3))-methyltransferase RlmH [Holdemanella sp.]|nr:23S rRNA (pseudouridine(1915)-N(3))-methyltransferase RlmH [Holdemanella sp.]